MSRNIKEIGKELMGKSLNSFHRKTGLTQLEKNNEMQDGILDGILSQVDDAYIEKTEQSNVMHLDGSGDGVVVLDSIEGNTMVNILNSSLNFGISSDSLYSNENGIYNGIVANGNYFARYDVHNLWKELKPNTTYTLKGFIESENNNSTGNIVFFTQKTPENIVTHVLNILKVTSNKQRFELNMSFTTPSDCIGSFGFYVSPVANFDNVKFSFILEYGDTTSYNIPNYFEGMQSSFEEQKEEDKYKIEILLNNKNLFDGKLSSKPPHYATVEHIDKNNFRVKATNAQYASVCYELKVRPNETYKLKVKGTKIKAQGGVYVRIYDKDNSYKSEEVTNVSLIENSFEKELKFTTKELPSNKFYGVQFYCVGQTTSTDGEWLYENVQLERGVNSTSYIPHKSNKIKLLLDEPLRNKDKLCIKDGKIVVERNSKQSLLDGNLNWAVNNSDNEGIYSISTTDLVGVPKGYIISDKLPTTTTTKNEGVMLGITTGKVMVCIDRNKLTNITLNGMKQYLNENPMQVVFDIETYYEEVLNEYGEPILLEGYENGTLYIDSTIVPTTTVRYTPKMESFKTLNEVSDNNTMLTNDINDNIIPYLMDVDLMIMEKEMALMSHQYKLRRTGEKDMTSMQKRTQDMLERLIKGKTLTEQECKTRVTTYLNAGKITDAQAEELMLLISEVYA